MENMELDKDWDVNYNEPPVVKPHYGDRLSKLSGDNDEIVEKIKSNIVSVQKAKQTLEFGPIMLMFIYIVIGVGTRMMVRTMPERSPLGFIVCMAVAMVLVLIKKITRITMYGKLRDMVSAWYMFAQTCLIMTASFFQAYYFGTGSMRDLKAFVLSLLTWAVVIVGVVVIHKSTDKEDIEVNPFTGFDLKKTYEWQRIRKERDKRYVLIRDLFFIPMIYSVVKFFACLLTNVLIQIAGEDSLLGDSVDKFVKVLFYVDWVIVGLFFVLALAYTIRYFIVKETERDTTEYIDVDSTIFNEKEPLI